MKTYNVDLAYHRRGEAGIIASERCDICKTENVPVLSVDGSEGEYGVVCICRKCIDKMFKEAE